MIKVEDLNSKNLPTDSIIKSNLLVLCQRLNAVETLWLAQGGTPFVVVSGLRSQTQQENLIKAGKSNAKHSKHLSGCAADIADPNGVLKIWLKSNPQILNNACLWCEASEATPNWCHFQISPPASGNRWFIP